MSKLHDDLKARITGLIDLARQTVAAATETEQSFADVYRQLDEAEAMLQQFLADNAAKGSSSGGAEKPQRASFAEPDQDQEQAREQEQDREIEQARSVYRAKKTAKEQGWKP